MVKINNIPIDNVLFSEDEENIIYAKDYKEEFFGIYNVNFLNESILCESKIPNYVICEINHKGKVFQNVSFKIKKSNSEKIIINENILQNKSTNTKFNPVKKIVDVEELIKEDIKKEKELLELKKKIEKEKQVLVESYNSLKKEYDNLKADEKTIKNEISSLSNKKAKIIEEIVDKKQTHIEEDSSKYESQRESILSEFVNIKNQNDILIEEKIQSFEESILESFDDRFRKTSQELSNHFKDTNEQHVRNITNILKEEILEKTSKILENKILELENLYSKDMDEKIDMYSQTSIRILEDFKTAKKDTEVVLEKHLNSSVETLKQNFNELFQLYTDNFTTEYSLKFDNIIKEQKEDIKNKTNQLIEKEKAKIKNLLEEKEKQIENKSNEIVLESSKKIKDISKKIETFGNQLNKINLDKKKMESIIQDAKKYTDLKMDQVLNEAKRFTRVMMDMVGGGGGSVAVQYAAGGKMNGDVVVDGDLTVTGSLSSDSVDVGAFTFSGGTIDGDLNVVGNITAVSILSGGKDITGIFAGEGEGDSNGLDGGFM